MFRKFKLVLCNKREDGDPAPGHSSSLFFKSMPRHEGWTSVSCIHLQNSMAVLKVVVKASFPFGQRVRGGGGRKNNPAQYTK